jgi:sRNA-binding regulator protein Hfq
MPGEKAKKGSGNSGRDRMTEDEKATTTKPAPMQTGPQFVPKLKGKKATIRLVSGGQPITGTLEGYSPYEILVQTVKGLILVFKHAIATIWSVDEPTGYRPTQSSCSL